MMLQDIIRAFRTYYTSTHSIPLAEELAANKPIIDYRRMSIVCTYIYYIGNST